MREKATVGLDGHTDTYGGRLGRIARGGVGLKASRIRLQEKNDTARYEEIMDHQKARQPLHSLVEM